MAMAEPKYIKPASCSGLICTNSGLLQGVAAPKSKAETMDMTIDLTGR